MGDAEVNLDSIIDRLVAGACVALSLPLLPEASPAYDSITRGSTVVLTGPSRIHGYDHTEEGDVSF